MMTTTYTLTELHDRLNEMIKQGYGDQKIEINQSDLSLVDVVLQRLYNREKELQKKAIEEENERLYVIFENRVLFIMELREELKSLRKCWE